VVVLRSRVAGYGPGWAASLDTGPGSSPGQALFRRYDGGGVFIPGGDRKGVPVMQVYREHAVALGSTKVVAARKGEGFRRD
jgi:hypothetical protein